jgi:hypothetical protein
MKMKFGLNLTAAAVLLPCLLFVPVLSAAQSEDRIRARYDRSTGIPDHVVLPTFLSNVVDSARNDQTDHPHNHVMLRIQRELELASYDEASELLNFFITLDSELHTDKNAYVSNEICSNQRSSAPEADLWKQLDAYDDNTEDIGARLLQSIEAHLTADQYARFLAWMDETKQSTIIVKTDHRADNVGRDPAVARQEICTQFQTLVGREEQ